MPETSLSILLYGDFTPGRLGASYQRAFEQLHHTVLPFDMREMRRDLAAWIRNRVGHRLTQRSLRLRRAGAHRWNERLLRIVVESRPDLLLLLNGDFLMPETLQAVHSRGVPIFVFHADNPFPPHYANRPETLACVRECACYFIWSRSLQRRLESKGARRVEYLPFAWDPVTFPHLGLSPTPLYDVIFVGGWDREREKLLTAIAGHFDLKIWGPGYWGTRTRPGSPLRHCWQGDAVSAPDAAQILVRAKVALNVIRTQNLPDGVVMRTFEVPGCGGFLLSTRTQGAVEIFPEEVAGAYFTGVHECIEQIERLLHDNERRAVLAQRSYDIVCNGHQYVDRARRILDVYLEIR